MSSVLHIDGVEFHPAAFAAEQVGYTREYILLLAREEKVLGKKIQNKWYVHMPSVRDYFASAMREQEDRRRAISLERKRELELHAESHAKSDARLARLNRRHTAIFETCTVVAIGLVLGATAHLGIQTQQTASVASAPDFINALALSLYQSVSMQSGAIRSGMVTNEPASPEAPADTTNAHTPVDGGVIVGTTVDAVQNSFSDAVHVSFDALNPFIAIVTPIFKSGEGEPYRFLLLPVDEVPQ
jgi:hypothetical protein